MISRVDFILRFFYCLFSLNKLLFFKKYKSDFIKLDNYFDTISLWLSDTGFVFKDKVILEIGPGNSTINAFNFLMNGAKKVYLIDKFPRISQSKAQANYLNSEIEFIKNKYNKCELFFINADGSINKEYIEYISSDLVDLELQEKVDLIYGISVFEHIKNIEQVINKCSELLSNEGLMYQSIDLRDHFNFATPFLFYKYKKKTWDRYCTKEGVSYTNRVRYNDYKAMFDKAKFNIVYEKTKNFKLPDKIDPFFRNQLDLDIGVAVFILKKN